MKVFISWSGELSCSLAEALRDWLPAVLQSVKPFFTPSDIEKGARWSKDIASELESSSVGIFCLTKENLNKPWIMFEAGALSKRVDSSRICPVLFEVDSTEIEGPLLQFQASPFSETEIKKLIKTINNGLGESKLDDPVLNAVFDMWWPKLAEKVQQILEKYNNNPAVSKPARADREILEEILELSRLNLSPRRMHKNSTDYSAFSHAIRSIQKLNTSIFLYHGKNSFTENIDDILSPIEYIIQRSEMPVKVERELMDLIKETRDILFSSPSLNEERATTQYLNRVGIE